MPDRVSAPPPMRRLPAAIVAGWLGALTVAAAATAATPAPGETRPRTGEAPRDEAIPETSADDGHEILDPEGAIIREISIRVGDVFDPESAGENRWIHRSVNRLHLKTRPRVIRKLLLFEEGDRYSRQQIEESERILRDMNYLYDATIQFENFDGDTVDVSVDTRDVWSLAAGASFGRSGGSNSSRFGLEDTNLFGSGKALAVKHKSDVDRTRSLLRFTDPALLGTRARLHLEYSDNSDGELRRIDLRRPFYSLDTRWSAGGQASSEDREDSHYLLGEVTNRFRHRQEHFEAYGGFSRGLEGPRAKRWTAGFTYLRDRFDEVAEFPDPALVPGDRTLAYPWLRFSSLQDRFIKARDVDLIHRTEDLSLGREFSLQLGFSAAAFGADRDQAIVDFDWSQGLSPGSGQLLFLRAGLSGRVGSHGEENVETGASVRYLRRNLNDSLLVIAARGDLVSNLDAENQLLLGGDSGLRGYPLRYLVGDGRALVTLEERFFTDWHLFKLVRVGAAVFVDAGGTWHRGATQIGPFEDRLLADVGAGLRFASTRSAAGSIVKIDVALPLVRDGSISGVQVLIQTRENF